MKKNGPEPFFWAEVPAFAAGAEGLAGDVEETVALEDEDVGVDEGVTTPRVGTSGIVTPAATADFLAREALFLTGRFADFFTDFFTDFLTADFFAEVLLATVFFAAAFLAVAFFAVRLAGAFFAAFLTGRFAATDLTPYSAITYVPLRLRTLSSFNPALNLRKS